MEFTMNTHAFYKHPNCTDTCIQVLKYFPIPGKDEAKVKVLWWRLKGGRLSHCMGIKEVFRKPITYWKLWKRLKEDTL